MTKREHLGDYEMSLDEAINKAVHIEAQKFKPTQQPHLNSRKEIILYEGKLAKKIAVFWGIRDHKTGEHNFNNLVLMTLKRTKKRGWEKEPEHSITIDDKPEQNSVQILFNFLASLPQVDNSGDYIVINVKDIDINRFQQVLDAVSTSQRKVVLLSQIIDWVQADPKAINGLMKLASDKPMQAKSLVVALNYARFSRTLHDFKKLVDENQKEPIYQRFLEENNWLFGTEYAELYPTRSVVLGSQLDFPLRRTVDGYLDVIEIKTPLNGSSPFNFDKGHNNYYHSAELSKAEGQMRNYLAELEAEQQRIQIVTEMKVHKIRGKIIIGRDGTEEAIKHLRRTNNSINDYQIMTFDDLIRIGERVLEIMSDENPELKKFDENSPSTDLNKMPF